MFFVFDKDVNMLFKQAKRKLKEISTVGYYDLFESLVHPLHWHKYSQKIKEYIYGDVMVLLLKKNMALLKYSEEQHLYFISRIQKDSEYRSRHTL